MRLQLRFRCLQMRARQLARANFRAPIETQRVCGSHDHDVDRDFDAGEMEKVPTGWRRLERRFCLRSEVFCRELRRMTMWTGPWIDKDVTLMNSKDYQKTNYEIQQLCC